MREFTLFWLDGKIEIIKGIDIVNAMNLAGYGGGAVNALDFYENGDKRDEYLWDKEKHVWKYVYLMNKRELNYILP